MFKDLIYKGAFKATINEEEEKRIINSSGQFSFRGELLKKSLCEIFNKEVGSLENQEWFEKTREWNEEQEDLKKESLGEKAFRNYRCKFTWYYLLQHGFTNFFGNEDWKKESSADNFKKFDSLIEKREPELIRNLTEAMEKYFIDNKNEVWVDKRFFLNFLPKTSFQPIIKSMPILENK